MYIVILSSILALFLTYLESAGRKKNGMFYGFILITFLGCIHYDYGNDYMNYYNIYKSIEVSSVGIAGIINGNLDLYGERGWHLLNYLFKYLGGFFVLVAVLNIIQSYFVYQFIKEEINKKLWPFAVFIYLFYTPFYLMSFTMMRQYFVICVFLGMWRFIKKRKWIVPVVVLFLCSFIHSSAIILIPFSFWAFLPLKNGKSTAVVFFFLFLILWIGGDFLNSAVSVFMNADTLGKYEFYNNEVVSSTSRGIGFIVNLIPFFVAEYCLVRKKGKKGTDKHLVAIALVGFFITPFVPLLPMIGRVGAYFEIFRLYAIPVTYRSIGNKPLRLLLTSFYVVITLFDYYKFFGSEVYSEYFTTFKSIFSQF